MKKIAFLLSFSLLLFTGCNPNAVVQEASEAVMNVSNEAIRIKTNTVNTANQVKDAVDSVNTAIDAIQEATEDIQAIGSNPLLDETKIPTEDQTTSTEEES